MPPLFADTAMPEGLLPALWAGVFQLAALAIVGLWVNIVYQRYRALATARQELIDEIDEFTIRLYRPRKLYLAMIEDSPALLAAIPDAVQRQVNRAALMEQCLAELMDAVGRLRSFQVKMVPLYGYHIDLFGHYLAVWRYIREVRRLMEQGRSLFARPEEAEGPDAFYKLMDDFRYRVMIERVRHHPPNPVQPPDDILKLMRQRADVIYADHFGHPAAEGKPST